MPRSPLQILDELLDNYQRAETYFIHNTPGPFDEDIALLELTDQCESYRQEMIDSLHALGVD